VDGKTDAGPIRPSREQRREDFRYRRLPALVWALSLLAVLALLFNRAAHYRYVAIAQARDFEISVPRDGVLAAVAVGLYDTVEPGAVVATLEDPELEALLAVSEATARQLQDEIESERATHRAEQRRTAAAWETDRLRFQRDEESLRLEALALRVDVESSRVAAERLALEARRAKTAFDAGLLSEAEYDVARLQHEEGRQRLAETEQLLARMEEELASAAVRRRGYESDAPPAVAEASILRPLEAAVEVELRNLAQLRDQREALVLRSPVAGQITQVLCRHGQAVVAGEPIAVVTERSVREIVTYLSEHEAARIAARTPVVLHSRTSGISGESVVLRVAESIQPLPLRLWRDARTPAYGRAIVIAPVPAMDLAPGELLDVRFRATR
jgi:multidrug resistance efflux pump